MRVENVVYYENLPFEDYLALPGYSFSGLKALQSDKVFVETEKMRRGTAVHNFLLTPKWVAGETVTEEIKQIARQLKTGIGSMIKNMKPELSITCEFHHDGLMMPYKGRIDLAYPGKLIIDIKVGDADPQKTIEHFRYDRQVSGYCIATATPIGFVAYGHIKKGSSIHKVPIDNYWWCEQVLKYEI